MLAAVLLAGVACTSEPDREASPNVAPSVTASTADPFAYCAQVGTIDAPDARYAGPRVPLTIAEGVKRATGAPADTPAEMFVRGTSWRCMDGKVYACTVGANLPCGEKADTNRTPSTAVAAFCQTNADAEVIPAAVTGRATVYQWRCTAGTPVVVRQVAEADRQGFLASFWHELKPS